MAAPLAVPAATVINPYANNAPVINDAAGAGQFERGLRSAAYNSSLGDAASEYYNAQAVGDSAGAQRAGLRVQRLQAEAAPYQPRVQSVGNIHGVSDALDWGAGVLGAAPVSMVGPMAGGLAAGIVARGRIGPSFAGAGAMLGSAAGMYPSTRDAARLQQMQAEEQGAPVLPPQQVLDDTSTQGAIQAGLESVVPGLAARSLVGRGAKAALAHPVQGTLQRVARDTALDAGMGAASEYAATTFESGRNPERDTSGDTMRYIDAAAGEGVVGGVHGVIGHAGDLAHTALGTGLDVGGAVAKAGGRAAMWAGGKTAEAAADAWENRPRSAAEAAIALGKGAADLQTKGEDLLTRAMQHGKDADIDTLLRPAPDKTPQGLMQDDEAKHTAASSLLEKIVAQPDAYPQYVQEAAGRYGNTKRQNDDWRTSGLADAINDWKRSETIGEGFTDFSQTLALTTGKAMAKAANTAERVKADAVDGFNVGYGDQRAEDGRANAQTPRRNMTPDTLAKVDALRDEFSPLLEQAIVPYTGLHAPMAQAENVGALAHGLREWISNGFSTKKGGKVIVPDGLLQMFADPVGAVAVAHNLMQRQGIVGTDSAVRMALVTRHIEVKQEAVKHIGSIVEDNILPTAQAKYGFSGARHETIGRGMQKALRDGGTANEKIAAELFGPRAALVVDALRAKYEAEHKSYAEHQPAEATDGVDAGDLESMTTGMDPNIVGERTQFHHYRDAVERKVDPETGEILTEGAAAVPFIRKGTVQNKDGTVTQHDEAAATRAETLTAKNGSSVRQQGYMDYLREKYSGQELVDHMVRTMDEHKGLVKNRAKAEDELNAKLYVLREDQASDRGEATDVHPDTFKHVTPGAKGNVWAEHVTLGKDRNPVGGLAAEGKIWLERADGKRFATSTNKIITHVSRGNRAEGGTGGADSTYSGLAGQVRMLQQGLASLLASAHPDGADGPYGNGKKVVKGATALKNRIGFREVEGGPIKWLKAGEDFPASLRMHSSAKATYGDAQAQAQMERIESMRVSVKKFLPTAAPYLKIEIQAALNAKTDTKQQRNAAENLLNKLQNQFDQGQQEAKLRYADEAQSVEPSAEAKGARSIHEDVGPDGKARTNEPHTGEAIGSIGVAASNLGPAPAQGDLFKVFDKERTHSTPSKVDNTEAKAADAKKTQFVLDALRKGVPAFNAMLSKATDAQRSAVVDRLRAMHDAQSPDAPVWGGQPPKNMTEFAKRARLAMESLTGQVVSPTGVIPKNPVKFDKDGTVAKSEGDGRRYNAMATKLHTDLGREGFGATHDSPIRHEGKFDWRSHQGKGEGNAAFGAGTYLSTSDGVHKSYRNQFTAKIQRENGGEFSATINGKSINFGLDDEGAPDFFGHKDLNHAEMGVLEWMVMENMSVSEALQSYIYEQNKIVEKFAENGLESKPSAEVAALLRAHKPVPKDLALAEKGMALSRWNRRLEQTAENIAAANAIDQKGVKLASAIDSKSPTYEVSVNIKPEQLLDWNAPLSEQSELVQKALGEVMKRLKGHDEYRDPTGAALYHYIEDIAGGPGEASDYLQSVGILGHKYAASGGKNDAHPNYVIYDDSKITTNYVHFSKQDPKHGMFGTEGAAATEAEQTKFVEDALRRLGPGIQAIVAKELFGTRTVGKTTVQIPISGEWSKGVIRASLFSHDISQIGAHEAMHEFFSRLTEAGANKVTDVLLKAANSAPVVRQLERLLDGQAAALAQIADGAEHAAEERLAYMFQFHQAGLLNIGPETQTVFQKIWAVLRKVAGVLNDDQQADMLLRAFNDGKAQTADAAAKVLSEHAALRKALYSNVNAVYQPMMARASRLVNTAETNLERTGNPVYHEIRTMFKRSVGENGKQGFLDAKDHQMKMWSSKVAAIFEGLNPKDLELAATYLHTGAKPTDPVVKGIVAKLKGPDGILPAMHKYLKDAGVQVWVADANNPGKGYWEDMGHVENYYPRAYDTAKIISNPGAFVTDLLNYNGKELQAAADGYNEAAAKAGAEVLTPKTAEDVAKAIANRLTNTFGQAELQDNLRDAVDPDVSGKAELKESKNSVGFTPFMQSVNKRSLHWIAPEILAKYGEKDVAMTITSYVAQGVKRAEYVRRFGNDGDKLQAMLKDGHEKQLAKLIADGMDPVKAQDKALKIAKGVATDVMALEGTLGYNISPTLRRINNSALVYENMRVLSTSLFSQFIDPMGMVVRGATMGDAWNAYKRGMREVVSSIKNDTHVKDRDSEIAELVGTVDSGSMLAAFGQLYSSQYMGAGFRKANDLLFKYNGMEGFNRGMQVSATRAAIGFIKRHAQKPGPNSEAYLAELNLKASDVKVDSNGDLDYTDPRIQEAIHQWVNGAVLRPNAAQRPAWGSDPHYMMFWHMKQFAYTFHDVIMKRAMHDYKKFGDVGPAGVLVGAFTPIMIASDAMKSLLITGSEPPWMKAGLASEIEHGAMRAGLAGKFQPAVDVLASPHRSVLGLGGPVVEQITQMFSDAPSDSVVNALPGANLWNQIGGKAHIEVQGED